MMKAYTLFEKIFCYSIALVLIFIQRLLSPFVLIRFSYFDSSRIGNLYYYYWTRLQEKEARVFKKPSVDIFLSSKSIANNEWHALFKRKFFILNYNALWATVHHLMTKFPNKGKFTFTMTKRMQLYKDPAVLNNIILEKKPFFSLTEDQKKAGEKLLRDMGVPEKKPFICFHNRDSSYLDQIYPDKVWSYHDYRDSSISNYLLAVQFFVDNGYYAIRTGATVKEKLKDLGKELGEEIIEYAQSSLRSDFMDVYLGSQCKIFLCSDTGMSIIPELFDVPAVYTNWVPIASISNWVKYGLFIPKRFYSHRLLRDLTFQEILENPKLSFTADTQYFIENEIELIENTAEEILTTVQEMVKRLNNEWIDTDEAKRLQAKYWSLPHLAEFKSRDFNISSAYLLNNPHLLN